MSDPLQIFAEWLAAAEASEPNDPSACALATVAMVDGKPQPDVRMVLLRGFDARGFAFYTNHLSAKGRQLELSPFAALAFHWKSLRRQVRVRGPVERVSDFDSDAYFAGRPRASQLSAWASFQSQPLDARATFEARLADMALAYPDAVPRPPHWGGYRIVPQEIEFWEDRAGRQHHRERYDRPLDPERDGWTMTLLYP